jgi:hypothetical protein
VAAAGLQVVLWLVRRDAWRLAAVGSAAAGWLAVAAWRWYLALRAEVAGLDFLVLGLALLPVAVLISLGKAGALPRWLTAWRGGVPVE